MLSLSSQVRIFAAIDPVDFRKAHDGLVAIVRDSFGRDPFDGSLFVFFNKRRDRVKLLAWDRNGFWLHYKRIERGTFKALRGAPGSQLKLERAELAMLLEGIDLEKGKRRPHFADEVRIHGRRGEGASRSTG
ncbi:MAG TPA: transposase [Planctomycetaceae bacterium]|nr:transposase [Planctomycetaceae bacterium]